MAFKPKQLDPEAVRPFTGTEVGALLENIDEKLNVILEGQTSVADRVERLEQKVDMVVETVAEIKVEVTPLRETVKDHETRIKRLEPSTRS